MGVVDMHCDTIGRIYADRQKGNEVGLRENEFQVDLKKLMAAGYLVQNFAMFVNQKRVNDVTETCLEMIQCYEEELKKNADRMAPVYTYEDVEKNRRDGKISAMLTVEEGAVLRGESELLKQFYKKGVRMLTLTWNYENELGFPNAIGEDQKKGLTTKGLQMVEEMNHLGMIVDVSHLSDGGFWSVCQVSKQPFVASHSNARAVTGHKRNMTDEMIRALSERGGVMGLNFCADFLDGGEHPFGKVADLVRHAQHIVNTGGIECLGLGTDYDGIDDNIELSDASKMPLLWEALKKSGFTEAQLDKIWEGNVLRLYRDVL